MSFDLNPDISRDLLVGLQMITATYGNGASQPLLASRILTFIDSNTPFIYLPVETCRMFEKEFGLVWDSTINFYPVDELLHQKLLNENPKFRFTIGNNESSIRTIDIDLPYASFDLVATPPLMSSPTSYFPLRRARNATQYTLGRTFLQEA